MKRRWMPWVFGGIALVAGVAVLAVVAPLALVMLNFPDPSTSPLDLPSGGRVDVIAARTGAGDPGFWELEYRTRIRLANRQKLADEVAAVWEGVESQADRSGASVAVIRPVSFSRRVVFNGWTPAVQSHESTMFSFVRAANGRWRRAEGWPEPTE